LIVNLYENSICNANKINKDIESIKEEIMNLNFQLEQKKSVNASLTSELDRVKEKFSQSQNELIEQVESLKIKLTKSEEDIKCISKELDELNHRKDLITKSRIEQSRLSKEIMDKSIDTVNYYQKMEYTINGQVINFRLNILL
jgi:seryl-tRNA synthetase